MLELYPECREIEMSQHNVQFECCNVATRVGCDVETFWNCIFPIKYYILPCHFLFYGNKNIPHEDTCAASCNWKWIPDKNISKKKEEYQIWRILLNICNFDSSTHFFDTYECTHVEIKTENRTTYRRPKTKERGGIFFNGVKSTIASTSMYISSHCIFYFY